MKSLVLSVCLLTSFASLAKSTSQVNPDLKKMAIEAFLKEANSSQTAVAKTISAINEENTDGRNPNGPISLPIQKADLQIVRLWSEDILNPWHYANKSEDGKTCKAGGDTAEFLILLNSNISVHMAQEAETVPFKVQVTEELSAKRKDGGEIDYCEEVAFDEKGEYVVAPIAISVESIKSVEIKEKE
jgi:hypothetical protein